MLVPLQILDRAECPRVEALPEPGGAASRGWMQKVLMTVVTLGLAATFGASYLWLAFQYVGNLRDAESVPFTSLSETPASSRPSAADCAFTYQIVNYDCPRFMAIPTSPYGIGDRFFWHVLALAFAIDLKATPVFTAEDWAVQGKHGEFGWVPQFLQLGYGELDSVEAVQKEFDLKTVDIEPGNYSDTLKRYTNPKLPEGGCNVMYRDVMKGCRDDELCYTANEPRAFKRIRDIVRCKFTHVPASVLPDLVYDSTAYNVAVHLRVGDISLKKGDIRYWKNLRDELRELTRRFRKVHYYFFVQRGSEDEEGKPPGGYEFLVDLFPSGGRMFKTWFVTEMNEAETLFHMFNADMLVGTGSAFPYVAMAVSWKPVVLLGVPKEGRHAGMYLADDVVTLDDEGRVATPAFAEVQALVKMRHYMFHKTRIPYRRLRR